MLVALGDRIRGLRKAAKMDQKDLAYKCGMEFQNLSAIETGNRNVSILTLARIAKALNVKVRDLIDF